MHVHGERETEMHEINWQVVNWSDTDTRKEIDRKIAQVIGWSATDGERLRWMDAAGVATGYHVFGQSISESGVFPAFAPTMDIDAAILAARKFCELRRLPFNLHFSPGFAWRAAFLLSSQGEEIAAENALPSLAICETIFKASGVGQLHRSRNLRDGHDRLD